jgi:hypothetical protein
VLGDIQVGVGQARGVGAHIIVEELPIGVHFSVHGTSTMTVYYSTAY